MREKASVLNTLNLMEKHHPTDASLKEYTEELSAYDNHPADLGTELFMMTMQANLENNEHQRMVEVDKALGKIKDGTYGKCERCGADIPDERLDIMPETTTCIKCSERKLEAFKIESDRPVEEELMSPSYRTSHEDYNEYTGFDEEDAYQEVARFNEVKDDPSFATGDLLGVFDDYDIGAVEPIENISEAYYKSQLPYTGDGIMEAEEQMKKKDR